jgi:hypothetical protein
VGNLFDIEAQRSNKPCVLIGIDAGAYCMKLTSQISRDLGSTRAAKKDRVMPGLDKVFPGCDS